MGRVRLLFSTSRHPLSAVIRAATWSRWSHVSIISGDTVIEAAAVVGVRVISLAAAIQHAKACEIVEVDCPDPLAVISLALGQVGKPYDYAAIFGIGVHRNWQDDDAWFCSELVAWAFEAAGYPLFRAECMRRVTPQHIWMLPPGPPGEAAPARAD